MVNWEELVSEPTLNERMALIDRITAAPRWWAVVDRDGMPRVWRGPFSSREEAAASGHVRLRPGPNGPVDWVFFEFCRPSREARFAFLKLSDDARAQVLAAAGL